MAREPGPVPPADFASRDLPIETVPSGAVFQRIHPSSLGAIHFGISGDNRFDDPKREYGVLYAARSLEGAFAETCLRELGATLIPLARLGARSVSIIETTAKLRLVGLHGPGLARVGATAALTSGTYEISQPWSRAIHGHPPVVDGIAYRSNHDNGELCVALFDRCRSRLRASAADPLAADPNRLAALLDRYRIGLG
jgi:hypothetical protein